MSRSPRLSTENRSNYLICVEDRNKDASVGMNMKKKVIFFKCCERGLYFFEFCKRGL